MFKKNNLHSWVETYLFYPTSPFQLILSFSLLPFTVIYCGVVLFKRFTAKPKNFNIPIISVGNLTVGGSGKTPLSIELAKDMKNVTIILRGYKRESRGMILVSLNGTIKCDVKTSGDEAMLYAKSLQNATVIVSEDRVKAILYAKKLHSEVIFLDDGFSKVNIKKFDILIKPKTDPRFIFCLPSGAYREPRFLYSYADLVIKEDIDFKRVVKIKNPTEKMVLVTGISKPQRLNPYLPKNIVAKVHFPDHYTFEKTELKGIIKKTGATSILTTTKDAVKMEDFSLPLSIMELQLEIKQEIKSRINTFLSDFR